MWSPDLAQVHLAAEVEMDAGNLPESAALLDRVLNWPGLADADGAPSPHADEAAPLLYASALEWRTMWIPDMLGHHATAAANAHRVIAAASWFGAAATAGPIHRRGRALVTAGGPAQVTEGARDLARATVLAGTAGNPYLTIWEYRAGVALQRLGQDTDLARLWDTATTHASDWGPDGGVSGPTSTTRRGYDCATTPPMLPRTT